MHASDCRNSATFSASATSHASGRDGTRPTFFRLTAGKRLASHQSGGGAGAYAQNVSAGYLNLACGLTLIRRARTASRLSHTEG